MTRPNILVVMVDQLTGTLFEDGPAEWLQTPNPRRLAERSVRFANAYTASSLCDPARASFMTGQLSSRTRVNGNTTCLAGKMHFVALSTTHCAKADTRRGNAIRSVMPRAASCAITWT